LTGKKRCTRRFGRHLGDRHDFPSNTSGLSINSLAEANAGAASFAVCGVHFFNPPRYMHLVE